MPRDEGKLNVGIEYQFRVITYAAACLSENEDVENYEIYTNLKEMPGFDDLIIKVKHKTKNEYSAYLCQIKHSRKDLNINYKKHKLRHYKDFVDQIVNTKNEYPFLQDVSKDNLEFWIFTNAQFAWSPQKPLLLERDSHSPIECDISSIEHYKTIFPSLASTQCVKLTTRSVIEDHYFFDNFILLQCQPDNDRIRADITNLNTKIFSVDTVTKLIIFVYEYLSKSANSKRPNCLRKDIFETELLRLCLSSFIVPPKSAVDIHDDSANIWNIITLMHDVTVIDNDTINMVPFVFGCFWKKIKHFYDNTFDWYNCISNANKLSNASDLWKVIINLYQKIGVRHWTSVPDTLDSLLIELWKCDYLPLLLNTDCRISLLQKYAHLKKKFIILDTKQNKTNEIHRGYFKMFTSAADIINTPEGNQLISDLFISLQGRQPNNLLTIIGSDMDLARQLKSSHILHLTENKRLYLKMKYLPVNSSIVFLIEDDRSFQEINVGELQIQFNSNVTIYCKSSDIDMYTKLFTNSQRFKTYSICYLRESEEQFEYIGGNVDKISRFLRDEYENNIYFYEGKAVTIIGKTFNDKNEKKYINRYLRRATVDDSFFKLQERQICIFTGDVDSLNPSIKDQSKQGCIDECLLYIENKLKENKSSFIIANKEDCDEYWSKLSCKRSPLFQIYVSEGKLELLRYKAFQSLSTFILYEGHKFDEKDFFVKTIDGATVVSGAPGIGKSTLLRSLFKKGDSTTYSLFCDLVDYRNVLTKEGAEIFPNPLRYVSNKFEHLTFSNFPASMYDNFLASLCAAYQHRRQLVLYIDSFDEVLPIYKQEVLKFVRCVFESNIRIIIASRFIANGLLLNNFEVQPVQIDRLDRNDVTSYFQEHDVSPDELAKIPRELLENPLYLTLLDILHEEGALTFKTINTFNLCKKVIEKKVELYYGRRGEHYNRETCQREDVLDIHKILAIAAIFGKETISKSEREYNTFVKKCNDGPIRLGIIVRFSDNYPIFLHHTYGEFLAAEWLSENDNFNLIKRIYRRMLDGRNIHVRRLFDSFLCDNLELHEAVIKEDLDLVEHFCTKKTEILDVVDKYGRTALHLAASYCYGEDMFNVRNCKILETVVKYMEQKQCDLSTRDSLMGYKWYEYIEDNESLCDEARRKGLTRILDSVTSRYVITIDRKQQSQLQRKISLDGIMLDPSSL